MNTAGSFLPALTGITADDPVNISMKNNHYTKTIDKLIRNAIDSETLERQFLAMIKQMTLSEIQQLPDLFTERLALARQGFDGEIVKQFVREQIIKADVAPDIEHVNLR